MSVGKVLIKNFRLFEDFQLNLSNKNCLITGPNGSGKTSCLEVIHLLLTRKSLKTRDLKECIRKDQNSFFLGFQGISRGEQLTISAEKSLNTRISIRANINNEPSKGKNLPLCQSIQARNLRLLEGEPELRRDLFNKIMFHVEHESYEINQRYKKVLIQRNRALKNKSSEKELIIWTNQLVEEGEELGKINKAFFQKFYEAAMEIQKDSSKKEELLFLNGFKIKYSPGWDEGLKLKEALRNSINIDQALGYTTQGPHRLDLKFYIQNKLAKSILSRGQQTLLILLIYFKMNTMLNQSQKAGLIYLLDDITSELDEKNLAITLEQIYQLGSQVIITSIKAAEEVEGSPFLSEFKQINL